MPIQVLCPSCGKSLKAPDSMAGKVAKCPSCGNQMTLPAPEPEVHEAEPVSDAAVNPYNMSDLLDEGPKDEYKLSSAPTPAASSGDAGRRPCPACGEMIVIGAAKCRYCGEIFDETLKKKEKKRSGGGGGSDEDDMTGLDWVLAIFCSGIGCIVGIIWLIQGKPKAAKMIGVSLGMAIVWNIVRFAIEQANR